MRSAVVLLVLMALVAAACSDDSGTTTTAAAVATQAPATTQTPATTRAPAATQAPVTTQAAATTAVPVATVALGEYGSDSFLDGLWDRCADGDWAACDLLFEQAAQGSRYSGFATTCGDRTNGIDWCVNVFADVVSVPALERLAGFFGAAEDLDERIKAAADQFNATFDSDTGAVSAEALDVINALDAAALARLVPGGLTEDLEVAVLAVFADLDSRIAGLQGGAQQGSLACLGFGGESARRFPDDLANAQSLAAEASALATAADSPESGMVAVRLAYIQGSNRCCDQCGGYVYEEQIEVDWEGRIFGPGWINAPFVATFDGAFWKVGFPGAG